MHIIFVFVHAAYNTHNYINYYCVRTAYLTIRSYKHGQHFLFFLSTNFMNPANRKSMTCPNKKNDAGIILMKVMWYKKAREANIICSTDNAHMTDCRERKGVA